MNPEFQEPAITYLPSLNSIKRNIVSENRTSFVVSNRGLNLSFIATRFTIYPASSSHDYKFHPHRVSYSKLYRFCEYDIETRTLDVCVCTCGHMCGKYTIIGRKRRCTDGGRCIVRAEEKEDLEETGNQWSGKPSYQTRLPPRSFGQLNVLYFQHRHWD